jgi:hypothetical protein
MKIFLKKTSSRGKGKKIKVNFCLHICVFSFQAMIEIVLVVRNMHEGEMTIESGFV